MSKKDKKKEESITHAGIKNMRLRKELKSQFNYVELFFMFLITIKQESSQRG